MTLVKAKLQNLDTTESITCMFNPAEYTFAKGVNWAESGNRGGNVPALEFTGGNPATLTLKLFFDTTGTGKDVRAEYTNKLWALASVSPALRDPVTDRGRPPRVLFEWGASWSFEAVVTNISTTFTLFLGDGTPTRANVELSLKQVKDPGAFPAQNPTSGGVAGHRTRVLGQGETLDMLAAQEYGEARHWRHIASSNNIQNPLRVRAGMVLRLPPLPPPRGEAW